MAMPGKKKKNKNPQASFEFSSGLVIERNKLSSWKKIGEGGCGEVYSVDHEDWGPLAVKKLGISVVDEG